MDEITSIEEKHLNKSMRAAQDVALGTRLKNLQLQDKYHYSGVRKVPSYTSSSGTVIIGNDGEYALYSDSSGSSLIEVFTITGGSFVLQDSITTYIYAKYNSGSPIIDATTDRSKVVSTRFTDAIPIFTLYRYGNLVNNIDWEDQGLALSEKMLLRTIDTDRFHRTEGLILGESASRVVTITSGSVYYGVNQLAIESFTSGSSNNYLYLVSHDASNVWTGSPITQYNNLQYQGTSGLTTLTNTTRYAVNWIYRLINNDLRYAIIVLGSGDYKLDEALASMPPSLLPNIVQTQCILVGRIIVAKSGLVATNIDSAFDVGFSPTSLDHNALFNLQGGTTDEYYHLTATEHDKISGSSQSGIFGDGTNYTKFENDGTMVMAGSATAWDDLFFPLVSGKQGQTDKPAFDTDECGFLFPSGDATQIIYINAQFPHSWKIGSTIYPHVHWKQTQSGSPVFKMDYKWFDIGGNVPASFTTYTMSSREVTYTGGSIMQLNYGTGGISGSSITGISSMMLIKLYRDDSAYTGNAVTYQMDIHIMKDGMGSRTEYAK